MPPNKSLANRVSVQIVASQVTRLLSAGVREELIRATVPSRRMASSLTLLILNLQNLLAQLATYSTSSLGTTASSTGPGSVLAPPLGTSVFRTRPRLCRTPKLVFCASTGEEITLGTTAALREVDYPSLTALCLPTGWRAGRNITICCMALPLTSVMWWCTTRPCHPASLQTMLLPDEWSSRLLRTRRMPFYPSSRSWWREPTSPV